MRPDTSEAATSSTVTIVASAVMLVLAGGAALYLGGDAPSTDPQASIQALQMGDEDPEEAPAVEVQSGSLSTTACYTGFGAFEPTIMGTGEGQLFMQANIDPPIPASAGVQSPGLIRSDKACNSWEDITPLIADRFANPPNSNDPYVHVDPISDRVFRLEMQGLECNWVMFSDDLGDTWTSNPLGCGHPAGLQDHPTLFTGPPATAEDAAALSATGHPTTTYICANQLTHTSCAKSLDGGFSFGPWRPLVHESGSSHTFGCLNSGGLHAHGTTGPDGTIYLGTSGDPDCNSPFIAISEDGGVVWRSVTVDASKSVKAHEVATAVDGDGTVYAFWIGEDDRPYLSWSTDKGDTWAPTIDIGPSDLGVSALPTIEAGASGDVAFAYISSRADDLDRFDAHMGIALDVTGSSPDVRTTTVNPSDDPIAARDSVGDDETERCSGSNKWCSIGDFIDITIDDDGRPWTAFVDVCTGACANGLSTNNDVAAFAGTLTSGPSLNGAGTLPALAG